MHTSFFLLCCLWFIKELRLGMHECEEGDVAAKENLCSTSQVSGHQRTVWRVTKMHIVITEGDWLLVGCVVHTLTVIFRKIAQYQCKKHSPNPKDSCSHMISLFRTGKLMWILYSKALPSLGFVKQPDLRMAWILYLILLPALLISILKKVCWFLFCKF